MSIVRLRKVVLYGALRDKPQVLSGLQALGVLHLVPLAAPGGDGLERVETAPQARVLVEALRDLQDCPRKRTPLPESEADPAEVAARVLEIRDRRRQIEDRRDFLRRRIAAVAPWGSFEYPPLEDLRDSRLWFYVVPHYRVKDLPPDRAWSVVGRDNRNAYVVLIQADEPSAELMPVPRTHTGSVSLSQLHRQLERVEIELDELQAEREALTRHLPKLLASLAGFEDAADLRAAAAATLDEEGVYALAGWAPAARLEEIAAFARRHTLALASAAPGGEDAPPTLMANPESWRGGEELVRFYTVPGYRAWDPSRAVFFSFAVFFAMIVSDAGYALTLGVVLALAWGRMGLSATGARLRRLGAALVAAAAVYGVLAGSYFGAPAPHPWLAGLEIFDLERFEAMMAVSIAVGALHVALANLAAAWVRRGSWTVLAPLGWIAVLAGGGLLFAERMQTGGAVMAAGLLAVLAFTGAGRPPLKRLVVGLLGLAQITRLFGDVLSYLRLFALGLASASLALTFNELAGQTIAAYPQTGLLMALPILVLGHALNFVLAMTSGLVHGLRLNFIEFFNWSLSEEGYPFRPFAKREIAGWTR